VGKREKHSGGEIRDSEGESWDSEMKIQDSEMKIRNLRREARDSEYVRKKILNELEYNNEIDDEYLRELIDITVMEDSVLENKSVKEKIRIKKDVYRAIRGYDVLDDILADDTVDEVMINGYDSIYLERKGKIEKYEGGFSCPERLEDVIQKIIGGANRRVNEVSPIVDSRLPDGSRINVVLPPVAIDGATVTIRRFPKERITVESLIKLGSLTREVYEYLRCLVVSGYNIIISGGTGSGKTTFLNALSGMIPRDERIITIEDSAELQIQGIPNIVRLEARNANEEGENEISIRDLIKTSLRMRPNRIIVGEVRDGAAIDMLQAMNTGHDGSLSTIHANNGRDALKRLEMMVLMGVDMPIAAIRDQIASGVDIIIQLGRLKDKSRKVLEIIEVLEAEEGEIKTCSLFKYDEKKGGMIRMNNELKNRHKLDAAGVKLP